MHKHPASRAVHWEGKGGGGEGGCPANVNTVGALYMYKHLAMWDD